MRRKGQYYLEIEKNKADEIEKNRADVILAQAA